MGTVTIKNFIEFGTVSSVPRSFVFNADIFTYLLTSVNKFVPASYIQIGILKVESFFN